MAFDRDALYTIINGYGSGYVIGYPGLNNNGDIFPIKVRNDVTGEEHDSFCAHSGSTNFAGDLGLGCRGYMVVAPDSGGALLVEGTNIGEFLKAYNYIYHNYGDLNEFRSVTQIVTWILLGAIDTGSDEFDDIDWAAVEAGSIRVNGVPDAKQIVMDVMTNYSTMSGGYYSEVIYLVCEIHNDAEGARTCQPQLVPIREPEEPKGRLIITKAFNITGDLGTWTATFTVTGPGGYDETITLSNTNNPVTLDELEPGTYYITEPNAPAIPGYVFVGSDIESDYTVTSGDTATATITNKYTTRNDPGSLVIIKEFSGVTNVPDNWSATITVTGPDGYSYTGTITGANRVITLTDLTPGIYTIAESNPASIPGYQQINANDTAQHTVTWGNETRATITNRYTSPEPGSLIITKAFNITGDLGTWTATFTVTGPGGYDETITLSNTNNPVTLDNLEPGTYYITEPNAPAFPGYVFVGHDIAASYTVTSGDTAAATITNNYNTRNDPGRLVIIKEFGGVTNIPDNWSATVTVTGPNGYSYTGAITGANRVITLTNLTPGTYTIAESNPASIPGYEHISANGTGQYTVTWGNETRATITNIYTPPPPDLGSLIITKAFNITGVPGNWSATVTVTGPNGYSYTGTITGESRTISLYNLEPGVYTITEANPAGIPGYVFVSASGEGSYTVSMGNTTRATITNTYDEEYEEVDEPPPPRTDFPPEEEDIEDDPPPFSELPKTGIDSMLALLVGGLCLSLAVAGVLSIFSYRSKKSSRQ